MRNGIADHGHLSKDKKSAQHRAGDGGENGGQCYG
jgi:hypothetical protein